MPSTITVSSLSDLHTALAQAQGGETILLQGGSYGDLFLGARSGYDLTFPDTVTIASADAANPAVFSSLDVRDTTNLTFDGLIFDYTFASGDPIWKRPFSLSDSSNITIRNATFDGDLASGVSAVDDGQGYGIGLSVRNTTGVTVENNTFFDFTRGLVITESGEVTVQGNDLYALRMDGMNFAEITGALIEGNHIHDFRGAPNSDDHSDMIQFWTNGTDLPSTDITIRGNRLDIGAGTATQTIFMRNDLVDRGLAGPEMFYRDILIEENVIVNAHAHGITVGETDGLIIRSNSVLHADGANADGRDASVEIPKINVAATSANVTLANNATAAITGWSGQAGWSVADNALVQDQNRAGAGFYGDVFLSSTLSPTEGVHDFRALEGSLLDQLDAGAAITRTLPSTAEASAEFQVVNVAGNAALYHFDASFSTADMGALPAGTQYLWDFDKGVHGTGAVVEHTFEAGGSYTVELTIGLPDGRSDSRSLVVDVEGPDVLTYAADVGFVAYQNGAQILLGLDTDDNPDGLQLGRPGVTVSVAREHVSDLLGEEDFRLSMTLTADSAASAGEVVRLHGSFIVSTTAAGEVQLQAFTTDGTLIRLTSKGAGLNDGAAHDIDITLDQGLLEVRVDGDFMASAKTQATLASTGSHDLVFGNPWNKVNFDGTLSSFGIFTDEDDFAPAALSRSMASGTDTFVFAPSGASADPLAAELALISGEPFTGARSDDLALQAADNAAGRFDSHFGGDLPDGIFDFF
ncbi:right-handed parallel beta-helix repeat-containing protein [Puniceibacterium confluentis]|uniref:right-handed parallel beta-helix repeat-containing protein n=1 Tax=Puniceibacterium confluentis TaxID=1958944 RepID=UPI0035654AE1